jgi:hypothetical protein
VEAVGERVGVGLKSKQSMHGKLSIGEKFCSSGLNGNQSMQKKAKAWSEAVEFTPEKKAKYAGRAWIR